MILLYLILENIVIKITSCVRKYHCSIKSKHWKGETADDVCLNASTSFSSSPSLKWCLDSGATSHFCNYAEYFQVMYNNDKSMLSLENFQTTDTGGTGKVRLFTDVCGKKTNVTLENH